MKQITLVMCLAVCVTSIRAVAEVTTNSVVRQPSRIELAGGFITQPATGNVVVIRNRQTHYTAIQLEDVARQLQAELNIPAFVVGANEKRGNVGIEVVLTDAPLVPGTTLLAAPEQSRSFLSVDWLVADKPNDKRRMRRLQIELYRALAVACGAGAPLYPPCVMERIHSASDIDHTRSRQYGPEATQNIEVAFRKAGVSYIRHVTYQKACQEGWAPAPTNDIQKAVWDEVHTPPLKPLKITFDPATQKGKVTK